MVRHNGVSDSTFDRVMFLLDSLHALLISVCSVMSVAVKMLTQN